MRISAYIAIVVLLCHYSPVHAWGKRNAKCTNGNCTPVQYSNNQPTVYYHPQLMDVRPSVISSNAVEFPVPMEFQQRVTPGGYSVIPASSADSRLYPVTQCVNGRCTVVYYSR